MSRQHALPAPVKSYIENAFPLEFNSERSGGFEPLRLVPRGKNVVLGLITSKEPALESQDQIVAQDRSGRAVLAA